MYTSYSLLVEIIHDTLRVLVASVDTSSSFAGHRWHCPRQWATDSVGLRCGSLDNMRGITISVSRDGEPSLG